MAEYSKQRKNSALQELKRLQEEDRATGIHNVKVHFILPSVHKRPNA